MEAAEYDTLRRLEDRFWWYRGLHDLVLREISLRARTAPRPFELLDAGCGTGGMLARLLRWEREVDPALRISRFGLDWSGRALGHAAARGGTPLVRASVEALPFPSEQFDFILSLDVIYHREVESDAEALREFHRCLKRGGTLLLHLPAFESLRSSHDAAIHTARRYRRAPLAALLRATGFLPRRLTYRNALLFPALAAVRWFRRAELGGSEPPPSDVRPLPGWLDWTLYTALRAEAVWLRAADLPCGLSLFALAERDD